MKAGGDDSDELRVDRPGEGPAAAEDLSFDPRSWVAGDAGKAPAPPPPSAPKSPRSRTPLIAAAAVAVALAGAAGFAILGHRSAPAPAPSGEAAQTRILTIPGAAVLARTLRDAGVAPAEADAAVAAAAPALGSDPGELRLEMLLRPHGGALQLVGLDARRQDGSGVALRAEGQGFSAQAHQVEMKTVARVARGEMDSESFYTSAVSAGINDALIAEFAQAFAFDFDFQREIHPGDAFEAVWRETVNPQGQAVGKRTLVYVSLTTKTKSRAFYRFTPPGQGEAGWYDGSGASVVRSLMRTPVDGARISSTFGWRIHPVEGFQKLHRGIDFAAPVGTPIYAAGDGTVTWASPKGPDGNLTIVRHDNGWETYYLHQSAYSPGIAPGARVRQGQVIGLVGQTGEATGPHLHYELHIDRQAVDPNTVQTEAGKALQGEAGKAFLAERDRIDAARASAL